MHQNSRVPGRISFGLFEIDLDAGELRRRGLKVRLQEKPFQVLAALVRRPGEVITREDLRNSLWPSDTFVDFDRGLNTALSKLREAIGDAAGNPRFIETLPRRGYRFIAPVRELGESAPGEGGRRMLAVLPFENLGGSEHDYFAEGLTEELISHLGQLSPRRLGVIARTSAIQYQGTHKSIGEIGAELKVDYVLEGTVRREGAHVRITAQLIEVPGQTHLWSASFDRELRDVLTVQQDVAQRVASALALELLPRDRPGLAAADPAAQEAYLRGRFFWGKRSEEATARAMGCFEQALAADPGMARAHSGIADCCNLLCWFGALAPREAGPRAAAAAGRALELNDSLSEAHASLALVRYWYEWNWAGAEEEFLRAIELNPSYATAHQWYASFLCAMERLDEAQRELACARQIDPLSLIISMNAADPLFFGRQFDRAIAHLRALLEQEPRFFPALFNLGRAYVEAGKYAEAIAAFEKAVRLSGSREGYPALAHAYAMAGRTKEARRILEDVTKPGGGRPLAAPMIARIHLGLGQAGRAFEWLNKGVEERSYWLTMLRVDPVYDPVRGDPRFSALLERVGLASPAPGVAAGG